MFCALLYATHAFLPVAPSSSVPSARAVRSHPCDMMMEVSSRRSAVLAATAALAAIPAATLAAEDLNENAKSAYIGGLTDRDYLAGNDEAMAAIARRTAERNAEAARSKGYGKTAAELRAEQEESKAQIIRIAVGGTLASTAFFYQNLLRLFTKITSGGQDSGYGSASDQAYREAKTKTKKKAGKAGKVEKLEKVETENFFVKLAKAANPSSNFK